MMKSIARCVAAIFALLGAASSARAQNEGFDSAAVAAAYHKLSGDTLDLEAAAQQSATVQRASNFDRPDAAKTEVARLRTLIASADPAREFVISVNDNISEYDHDHGEFSIGLFQPATSSRCERSDSDYQLVFANAERGAGDPNGQGERARLRREAECDRPQACSTRFISGSPGRAIRPVP